MTALISAVVILAPRVLASALAINPTLITLTASQPTRLLAIRNADSAPARFQLSVYDWVQSDVGETVLTPTRDIILYPPLFTVEPRSERKVRIGSAVPIASMEKSYRVIVEELPGHMPADGLRASGLSVLTRLSIPIFLQPPIPRAQVTLTGLSLEDGVLAVRIENSGTVHFLVTHVEFQALDAAGTALATTRLNGWYVLAGTPRRFSVPIETAACQRVASVLVRAQVRDVTLDERLVVTAPSCGAAGK